MLRTFPTTLQFNIRDIFVGFVENITKFNLVFDRIKNLATGLFQSLISRTEAPGQSFRETSPARGRLGFQIPQIKNSKRMGKSLIYLLVGLLLIVIVGFTLKKLSVSNSNSDKISIKDARASLDLGKELSFPLKNDKGEEVSQIKYMLEKAELRDEIVIKGQRGKALKGRTFLIINIKITNEFNKPIEIDTRDYLRLSVNGNKNEWLAPDIHNDPVEIQAISTKYTRLGFPINESDTNLILQVGEIGGQKEEISLDFK